MILEAAGFEGVELEELPLQPLGAIEKIAGLGPHPGRRIARRHVITLEASGRKRLTIERVPPGLSRTAGAPPLGKPPRPLPGGMGPGGRPDSSPPPPPRTARPRPTTPPP